MDWVWVTELNCTILIPRIALPSRKSHRGVHEIEVEVVNPKVVQGFPTSCFNVLRVVLCVPKLARDKDLRSGNTGGNNSCSNFSLVAITSRTI